MSTISSLNGLGGYSSLFQMNAQSIQQRQNDLFSKLDSDSSGGIDKTEFSDFAKKLSEHSGNSINVDDVFKNYDSNNDGTLSSDELKAFMKDNAPQPPPDGMGGGMFQMNAQSMQQRQDDLFTKLDSDSSGGIDKSEFSTFAEKVSKDSGKTVNVDDVFKTYDANNDGTLSSDELKAFMKDNAPPPPGQRQQAASAYGTDQSSDQVSTLLDLLKDISKLVGASSDGNGSSISTYLSKLMESIQSGAGSSVLNVTA